MREPAGVLRRWSSLLEQSGTTARCTYSLPRLLAVWATQRVVPMSGLSPLLDHLTGQSETVVVCPQANSWVPNSKPLSGWNLAGCPVECVAAEVEFFCVSRYAGALAVPRLQLSWGLWELLVLTQDCCLLTGPHGLHCRWFPLSLPCGETGLELLGLEVGWDKEREKQNARYSKI